jgi:nucleotide-binding universal stress UspA family protein
MQEPTLRWTKTGNLIVSSVKPGTQVRVHTAVPVGGTGFIDVFQIPERAVARALRRLTRSPGRYITSLRPEPGDGGVLTECWSADQAFSRTARQSTYVARQQRAVSGPLRVFGSVAITMTGHGPSARLGLDLGAITGLPLPSIVASTGQRDTTLTAVVEATQDPTVGLSVLTGSGTESPIADYLAEYLAEVSELFGVHPAELEQAWRAEFSEYLDDPLPIGAEADPSWVTVDEGEPAASTIQLYAEDRPGSAMLAIVATGEHGEIVAVSDLIGITMTEDGLVFRDF